MDFIDDFIQEYKNSPCLWKADSANYKNRGKRQEAYMRLIEVASKHGEHYNVERTKQKINNLRCAFRHQLKKYNELKSKGEKEEPYCPKRKYFESLMFLKDEEARDKRLKIDHHQNHNIDTLQQHCVTTAVVQQQQHIKRDGRLTAEQDPATTSTSLSSGTVEILEAIETRSGRMSVNGGAGSVGGNVVETLHMPNNLFNDICKEIHKDNGETETEEDLSALDERGAGSSEIGNGTSGTTLILEKDNSNTVNISVISSDKGLSLSSHDLEEITGLTTASTPTRKDHHQQQTQQLYIMDTSPTLPSASTILTNTLMTPKTLSISGLKMRKRSSSFSSQHSIEMEDNTNPITMVPASGTGMLLNKPAKSSSSEVCLDLDHLITLACKSIPNKVAATNSNDHYNAFGDIVAHKLRTMDPKQSLYAEKIISDVLYLGQMKCLTAASIERCSLLETTATSTVETAAVGRNSPIAAIDRCGSNSNNSSCNTIITANNNNNTNNSNVNSESNANNNSNCSNNSTGSNNHIL